MRVCCIVAGELVGESGEEGAVQYIEPSIDIASLPISTGYLFKKSSGFGGIRSWRKRWFQLYNTSLFYFKNKSDAEPSGQFTITPFTSIDTGVCLDENVSLCIGVCCSSVCLFLRISICVHGFVCKCAFVALRFCLTCRHERASEQEGEERFCSARQPHQSCDRIVR